VRPLTARCTIDAPRARVFDYLVDLANHTEFTDHFMKDFRLERLDSRGIGAAANFRIETGLGGLWAEAVVTEVEAPYRILLEGKAGRIGRIEIRSEYKLTPFGHDMTSVELTVSSDSPARADRLREALGGRAAMRRRCRRALGRLKQMLEEGQPSAHAVRVAAG
jgi:uncharacterized protein YndB with AHSA1/START domain